MRTIDELNRQMRETRTLKGDKDAERKQLDEDTVSVRQQIEEQKEVLQEWQGRIKDAKAVTLRAEQRLKEGQKNLEDLKQKHARFEDEHHRIEKVIYAQQKKNDALKVELEKEQMKVSTQERTLKDLKHDLKVKMALLKKAEKEYAPLLTLRHDLEADLGTLKTELFLTNK